MIMSGQLSKQRLTVKLIYMIYMTEHSTTPNDPFDNIKRPERDYKTGRLKRQNHKYCKTA